MLMNDFLVSYDARRGSWNLGARWSDGGQFGTRAYFQVIIIIIIIIVIIIIVIIMQSYYFFQFSYIVLTFLLQLSSSPAELRVENVKEGEEGVYRF